MSEPLLDSRYVRAKMAAPIICERPRCRRHAVSHIGLTALCSKHIRELANGE